MIFLLLVLGYTVFDRIGYNLSRSPDWSSPAEWHFAKAAVHGFIWIFADWQDTAAFSVVFWTFGCDWLYYATTRLPHNIRWLDTWEDTKRDFGNGITHAYWTIGGFFYYFFKNKKDVNTPIPVDFLTSQACIGLGFAIGILALWK
jgi:hypothetical protein